MTRNGQMKNPFQLGKTRKEQGGGGSLINKRQSKGVMGKGEVRSRDRMRHEREKYIKRRQWVM